MIVIVFALSIFVVLIGVHIILTAEDRRRLRLTRKHFGRPALRLVADENGLHVDSDPDPDHSTRCRNFLNDR